MSLRCMVLMLGVVFSALAARATVLEVNVPDGTEQTGFTSEQLSAIKTLTAADEIKKTGGGTAVRACRRSSACPRAGCRSTPAVRSRSVFRPASC